MSKPDKKIIILTEDELRKTFSRLTFEIIEKTSNLEKNLANSKSEETQARASPVEGRAPCSRPSGSRPGSAGP